MYQLYISAGVRVLRVCIYIYLWYIFHSAECELHADNIEIHHIDNKAKPGAER